MDNTTFTTIQELHSYIAACIEAGGSASAEEFDLDGIADTISIYSRRRGVFCLIVDTDDFWAVVEAHYTKGVNA